MTPALVRARLLTVSMATLHAEGRTGSAKWERTGTGLVEVVTRRGDEIDWSETGEWSEAGRVFGYRAKLRWTFVRDGIELSHLRRGPDAPVHLATLRLNAEGALEPRTPHLCGDDQYLAEVRLEGGALTLAWRATGPKKSYRLTTVYR